MSSGPHNCRSASSTLVPAVFLVFKKMNLCSCEMIMPVAVVEAETLATFAEGLAPGFIISPSYDRAWVQQNLLAE